MSSSTTCPDTQHATPRHTYVQRVTEQAALKKRHPHLENRGDFCMLDHDPKVSAAGAWVLLLAEPGDLILWDSRTVHGGVVGEGCRPPPQQPDHNNANTSEERDNAARQAWRRWKADYARMSVTVAMTERSRASAETLRIRRAGFEAGVSFNHTPHEAGSSTGTLRCRPRHGCVRA